MKKLLSTLLFFILFNVGFATQPEKLTVVLDWFPNPDHAPLIIAKNLGYFKEQNLDVELLGPADPTDAPKWVAAKKVDLGITYEPEFMVQVDAGLPLIRVGTLIDRPLNALVVLKESGIQSLADLKGKRVGASNNGVTGLTLKIMLAQQGLSMKNIEFINVRYNLSQALLSHQVDAVTGMMRNFEVPQLELAGHPVLAFYPEEHGIPNYSELIFVANYSNANDKRFPRFMEAIKKANAYIKAHPEESWKIFAKLYPESNNKVNRAAWFATIPYFANDPAYFNSKEWQEFAQFMEQNHLIKKAQPISRYAIIPGQ